LIESASQARPSDLDGFPITNPPIYPDDGNDGVGYRNAWSAGSSQAMTGPSCIDNSVNDCQLTAPGAERNTDSRRGSHGPGMITPAPLSSPTSAPWSSPTLAPQSYPTSVPQPRPTTVQPPLPTCISNHPTIDYSVSCAALETNCELYSFCKRVSSGSGIPTTAPPVVACVSNHPTIDYSAACKALAATCEQHSYCKLEVPPESGPESEPEAEPESEPEVEPKTEPESEPESELEAEPESESEPESDLEPETEPEQEVESEPESEAEAEPEPEASQCVPIGTCGAHTWCNQEKYDAWCHNVGTVGPCPAPFCEVRAQLAQVHARRYLRVAKHPFARASGNVLVQRTTNMTLAKGVNGGMQALILGHMEL